MKCKDCKYREDAIYYGVPKNICISEKICDEDAGQENTGDQLLYQYNEGGAFFVGDNFGCVHFKPVKET